MDGKLGLGRILLVVDSSESGVRAARLGVRFAAAHGSQLVAVAAVDTEVLSSLLTTRILVEPEAHEFDAQMAATARASLNYVAELARAEGVRVELLLRRGSACSAVLNEVRRVNPDLIVMGTVSTSFIKQDLASCQRRLIVDGVRCPILLVP